MKNSALSEQKLKRWTALGLYLIEKDENMKLKKILKKTLIPLIGRKRYAEADNDIKTMMLCEGIIREVEDAIKLK